MSNNSKNNIINITSENVANIQEEYKISQQQINDLVHILNTWIKQQPHLPQNTNDDFLSKMLLRNKFRIEQTKTKLENFYSLKRHYKKYYEADYSEYVPSKQPGMFQILPDLCPKDHCRVLLYKFNPDFDTANFDMTQVVKYCVTVFELLQIYDYSMGEHMVVDLGYWTLDHIKRVTIPEISNVYKMYQAIYSGRLRSLNIVNAPSFVAALLNVLKLALPAKIYDRIKVHKNNESLIEALGASCLTKEYGGDLPEFHETIGYWDKIYLEHQPFFKTILTNVSNEKLRIGPVKEDANFGTEGTFKKLNID